MSDNQDDEYEIVFIPEDIDGIKKGLDYVFNENPFGYIAPMNFQYHGMGYLKAMSLIDLLGDAGLIKREHNGEPYKIMTSREEIEKKLVQFIESELKKQEN